MRCRIPEGFYLHIMKFIFGDFIDFTVLADYYVARITDISHGANQTLVIIRKSFHFTDSNMFITLYKSLVRPVIKYGNTIW